MQSIFRINLCSTSIGETQVRYQSPSIQRTFYFIQVSTKALKTSTSFSASRLLNPKSITKSPPATLYSSYTQYQHPQITPIQHILAKRTAKITGGVILTKCGKKISQHTLIPPTLHTGLVQAWNRLGVCLCK